LKFLRFLICFLIVFSCKKENASLSFSEISVLNEDGAKVEINIPKAQGNSQVSEKINATINDFVCSALQLDTSNEKERTINASVKAFNESFFNFNKLISSELKSELPVWEALIDSELLYKNEYISCIAINASINTGGANTSMVFKFFNFDNKTGDLLTTNELVNNLIEFKALVKKYYDKEISSSFDDADIHINNNTFKLPETLGFNDEGVIILYGDFDLGVLEKEIIEFTIPYEVANQYLNI
jgi:hypothetical protein